MSCIMFLPVCRMLTPEGPPPYTAPVRRPLEKETLHKEIPHHIISMPDKLYCDNYMNRWVFI